MMKSGISMSDAAIKRAAIDTSISELRDQRLPLSLKFYKNRAKATWYLVRYEKRAKKRYMIGHWPALSFKDVQVIVPKMLQKLGAGYDVQTSKFVTVGNLLTWYKDRTEKEAVKSDSRRSTVVGTTNKHLLPLLANVRISELSKAVIDDKLMLPLQAAGLMPSTIRNYFGVLKRAFKSAQELGMINLDPLAGMKFVDYIQRRILARESLLLTSDRQRVIDMILGYSAQAMTLQLIMLMFALRIGEARQVTKQMVHLDRGLLAIPGRITKTGHDNNLPITTWAAAILKVFIDSAKSDYLVELNGKPISKNQSQELIRSTAKGKYRSHDLRKLARSTWVEMQLDYWVSERLLNHRQTKQDQAYIGDKVNSYDVKLSALQQYHDLLFINFNVGTMQAFINSKVTCSADCI